MHLSHPFSTFYEQYICIHLWKLVSFCSKNAGFDGVWRCLTYMAPRFVSVWGSMQVLHWANSASGLGMGEKLGKHQKQSGNLRCFCFFPHKVPPKPTKTLQKEMLDHIFKGGLLRTIYDSSIKIYNLPYNIRPYFFLGGGIWGIWGWEVIGLAPGCWTKMALTPWVHGPSWSSFHAPWRKLRPHGMFVVVCCGVRRGGDMVSDMVNPGDLFSWNQVLFLISCYHVSRCLDTWIIVDHSGSIRGNINCCTAMFALSFSSW